MAIAAQALFVFVVLIRISITVCACFVFYVEILSTYRFSQLRAFALRCLGDTFTVTHVLFLRAQHVAGVSVAYRRQ